MAFLARVTGVVLRHDQRAGISKASGNPYDITTATILVASKGTTEITGPTEILVSAFPVRSRIDVLVSVDTFRDQAQVNYVDAWDENEAYTFDASLTAVA